MRIGQLLPLNEICQISKVYDRFMKHFVPEYFKQLLMVWMRGEVDGTAGVFFFRERSPIH